LATPPLLTGILRLLLMLAGDGLLIVGATEISIIHEAI
jgi:hypothetical protein